MSKFDAFMKRNRMERKNILVPASSAFRDDNGKIIEWELRPLTSAEVARINNEAVSYKTMPNGKLEMYTDGAKLAEKLIVKSVVYPDLTNAELQDSYGVKNAARLLHELLEDPGEYNALSLKIQEYNHMGKTLESRVKEAKNS